MHQHSHNEDKAEESGSRDLATVAFLNFIGFLAELIGGLAFGSIALLSDAFHMLFDMLAYALAFSASFLAERYGDNNGINYSVHRLEPLAAFVNGFLLIPMVGYIVWESYQRFLSPVSIDTIPVITIAVFGLLINIVSVFVLNSEQMSLNEKGAFYHLLGDAGGSVAVIVSVIVIELTGIKVIDPIVASAIGILILWSAYRVLIGSGSIFMHQSPSDKEEIKDLISDVEGVEEVGCVHSWQICSEISVVTVHAQVSKDQLDNMEHINEKIHHLLAQKNVDHATVELRESLNCTNKHLRNHDH